MYFPGVCSIMTAKHAAVLLQSGYGSFKVFITASASSYEYSIRIILAAHNHLLSLTSHAETSLIRNNRNQRRSSSQGSGYGNTYMRLNTASNTNNILSCTTYSLRRKLHLNYDLKIADTDTLSISNVLLFEHFKLPRVSLL